MADPDDDTENATARAPRLSVVYNNNGIKDVKSAGKAMDDHDDQGHHRDEDDGEEEDDRSEQDEEDTDNVDTTDAAGTADGDDAEDGMFDAADERRNGDAPSYNRELSDLKGDLDADEEATSQDDDIMESEPTTDAQSAVTAPASGTDTQPQYSTRGRHHSHETDVDVIREKLPEEGEIARPVGASFLDSLGEEERRTKTRFLPRVDGIHVLFKSEVKQDLLLARTHMSTTGVASKLNAKSQNKARRDEDDADGNDDDDQLVPSEDERTQPDAAGSAVTTVPDQTAMMPSRAFVVSSEEEVESSPHTVETVTAFNPPLPPESAGPKKKHRMMRWERQPADVETDLNSYRKTVTRTRQELIDAQAERERMESVAAHLRAHFLAHVKGLEQEGELLNNEFSAIQQDCVKAADLLQSRTRSRGVGKGSFVMRDVLHILKQKGAEIASLPIKDDSLRGEEIEVGIGGIPAKAFLDWERGKEIVPAKPASAWLLPGQTVRTQYGKGEVLHVFGPRELDVSEAPVAGSVMSAAPLKAANHGFVSSGAPGTVANGGAKVGGGKKGMDKKNPKKSTDTKGGSGKVQVPPGKVDGLLAARACVKLSFGVGFFPLVSLSCHDDVSSYSDAMLVSRWKTMSETALSVAGCIDYSAMANYRATAPIAKEPRGDNAEEAGSDDSAMDMSYKDAAKVKGTSLMFMPYDANLIPTSAGRAMNTAELPILALEQGLNSSLFDSCKVLGTVDNKGIPTKFREWEDIRVEGSWLRAQVLQRRNELARQRRLRVMNERALAATTDKAMRVENLVSEMRADLKSLKDRLDYELIELGEYPPCNGCVWLLIDS